MRIARRGLRAGLRGVFAVALLCAASAGAHPLAPALLGLSTLEDGRVEVEWKTPLLRPRGVEIRPILPPHCRPVSTPTYREGASDLSERWTVDCGSQGLVGATLSVTGLDASRTDALVRITLVDGRTIRSLLSSDDANFVVPERESALQVVRSYGLLGTEHLLSGLDHVLFVLGLVLLVHGGRSLIATITAFTLGHSVTLTLATLGLLSFPSSVMEVGIAFSILVLGAELVRGAEGEGSLLRRRPWAMSCVFGLLHGMGFAGALAEIGLPPQEIPLALLAFNLGIELGQLLVVAPAVALALLLRRRPTPLPAWPERAAAYAIGSLAAYWMLERSANLLGLG